MDGQLDLFDLLSKEPEPEPPPVELFTCLACGHEGPDEHGHHNAALHWMDINPPPICGLLHTRRCHVVSAMRQLTGAHPAMPCCWDKYGIHGKAVNKPTRQHRLDHIRNNLELARIDWHLHLDYLNDWVARAAVAEGVKFGEAFQEWAA